MALDATVDIAGASGSRTIPFAALHRPPGSTPHVETTLAPGELITGLSVPAGPWTRRSLYLKIRDRQSYEFALASAAVALDIAAAWCARPGSRSAASPPRPGEPGRQKPRSRQAADEATATDAARIAFAGATPREHNAYKVALGQKTVVRALLQAAALEG